MTHKMYKLNPFSMRTKGISKVRWDDNTINYLMKVNNRITCVQLEKENVIEEAKIFKEMKL